jgi:hypothetical protein
MAKRYKGNKVDSIRKQGMDYVHSQERQDGAMIHEDYNCMSLLPYNVIIKEYPKNNYALHDELNDTITGIDRQMNTDSAQIRRANVAKKV